MKPRGPFSEDRPMPKQEIRQLGTMVPLTNPEPALFLCGLGYNTVWPWSCHQYHLPKDPLGVMSPHGTGNRLSNFTPGCGPEAAMTWRQLLLANRSICPGTRQETHPSVPHGKPANLCLAADPEMAYKSVPVPCSFWLESSLPTRGLPRDMLFPWK